MTVILECTKTGRFWFCDNKQQAEREAVRLGLQDYTIGEVK